MTERGIRLAAVAALGWLAAMPMAAQAQSVACQGNSGTQQGAGTIACARPPGGSPLPPFLFNSPHAANIQALQGMAIWSGSVLGFGNARFASGQIPDNVIGGNLVSRTWRDKGGSIVTDGLSFPGSESRTSVHGAALQDIYDAGSALGLEGDQSLYVAGFANLADSRTVYAVDRRETNERDLTVSAAAAWRTGETYLIGLTSLIHGHGSLGDNASGSFGRYSNSGFNAMVTAGRRFPLIDPALRGFAMSLDLSGHLAYFEGRSAGFTDDRGTVYGRGRAQSWLGGGEASLQFIVPGKSWRWTPYIGLTSDRYLSPHVSVDATDTHGRIDYVSRRDLSGVETGFAMTNAKELSLSVQAYSQSNAELNDTGILLSLSHPM
ncbi:autotransporter outer membrane beta-barrel domain-containing protein [Asticcacaulis solisilvae]|uniref:autotransporter outer membrane beta-barrel domain-containing protein n=1 Tax=Asticcacaulis solisilvae TaxID=1217274 RepID=UPI003FD821E8